MNIGGKYGGEFVSFDDSHKKLTGNLLRAVNFETFTHKMTFTVTDANKQDRNIVKSIKVESFLCRKNDINNSNFVKKEWYQ